MGRREFWDHRRGANARPDAGLGGLDRSRAGETPSPADASLPTEVSDSEAHPLSKATDSCSAGRRASRPAVRRRHPVLAVLGSVLVLLLAAATAWLRPLPAQGAALERADGIDVETSMTAIALNLDREQVRALIFQPGAKVDPRAYVPLLAKVAKGCDCGVVIVKQPLEVGFLASGAPEKIIAAHPEVTSWAIGGHSLGGVVASQTADADARIEELVLWASYPASALTRTDLGVASIWGSADGLATSDKRVETASRLPADAVVTIVEGGIHSFFGDYGIQPGDGTPSISRVDAQAQIVDATVKALRAL